MSGPPDWDNIPPGDPNDYGSAVNEKRGGGNTQTARRPKIDPAKVPALAAAFYTWLASRETHAQLQAVLPDHIDLGIFIETAKSAVMTKPELLREDLRPSLLLAVANAAGMGLLPNGKQGALLVRWDRESGERVVWQPMVWGIVKLGRDTGAIKGIRSVIVFHGERVEIDEVANTITHRRGPEELMIVEEAYASMIGGIDKGRQLYLPDQFLDRITLAYCIVTGTDGSQIMRWMTGARIKMVRNSSPAKWGPWAGAFMDEMVAKTIMLWTTKLIDLDPTSAPARRFQAALETDMHIDFDRGGEPVPRITHGPAQTEPRALAAPGMKLDILSDAITRVREPAIVNAAEEQAQEAPHVAESAPQDSTAQEGGQAPADGAWLIHACQQLTNTKDVTAWLAVLRSTVLACSTAADLTVINAHASVKAALAGAPPPIRAEIEKLLQDTAKQLANPPADDGFPGDTE